MEMVREIEAARGDCTAEALKRSDEACVRMMEQYAGMGTELVHTYLGGLRALDLALARSPAPLFDTVGFGRAVDPALLQGALPGATGPNLRSAAPFDSRDPTPDADTRGLAYRGGATAGEWAGPATSALRSERATRDRIAAIPPAPLRSRAGDRYGNEWPGRSRSTPFGYTRDRWGVFPMDPYTSGGTIDYGRYRYSGRAYAPRGAVPGVSGYGYDGMYGYGAYGAPDGWFDSYGGLGYGYEPYGYSWYDSGGRLGRRGFGYDPYDRSAYDYGAYGPSGYGYDQGYWPRYGYDPYAYDPYGSGYRLQRREGYGSAPYGYDPYGRDPRYGDRDISGERYDLAPGYGYGGYDAYDGYGPPPGYGYSGGNGGAYGDEIRSPAEDWGYLPEGDEAAGDPPPANTREGPPRHAPGILLPPAERLRRPWLND